MQQKFKESAQFTFVLNKFNASILGRKQEI